MFSLVVLQYSSGKALDQSASKELQEDHQRRHISGPGNCHRLDAVCAAVSLVLLWGLPWSGPHSKPHGNKTPGGVCTTVVVMSAGHRAT
jgi:hypothetical protein